MNADEIHLYLFRVVEQQFLWMDHYDAILDAEERSRANAFKVKLPRQTYQIAHLLLRLVLSQYAPLAPAEWRFVRNAYGRPEIANLDGLNRSQLRFNLTHTRGCIACAIVQTLPIGIDVESHRALRELTALVNRMLTPVEAAEVFRAENCLEQARRFFEFWTLKEAYVKGRGIGLSLPFQQFAFDRVESDHSQLQLRIDPNLQDDETAWQFVLFSLKDGLDQCSHSLAVGVRRGDRPDLAIRIYEVLAPEGSPQRPIECVRSTSQDTPIFWEKPYCPPFQTGS